MRWAVFVALAACHDVPPSPPVAIPSQPTGTFPRAPAEVEEPDAAVAAEEAGPPETITTTKQCGWVDPATVKRAGEGCTDDALRVPSCDATKPCEPCDALRRSYKPGVIARALECLRRLPDCEPCAAKECVDRARKSACSDPSTSEICMRIGFKCPAVSMEECRMYLSGMNAAGRAKMLACSSTPDGCGLGIHHCAEEL